MRRRDRIIVLTRGLATVAITQSTYAGRVVIAGSWLALCRNRALCDCDLNADLSGGHALFCLHCRGALWRYSLRADLSRSPALDSLYECLVRGWGRLHGHVGAVNCSLAGGLHSKIASVQAVCKADGVA